MRSWRVGALGIPQVVFLLYQKGRGSIAARCSVASPGRQEKCSRAVSELNRMVGRAPIGPGTAGRGSPVAQHQAFAVGSPTSELPCARAGGPGPNRLSQLRYTRRGEVNNLLRGTQDHLGPPPKEADMPGHANPLPLHCHFWACAIPARSCTGSDQRRHRSPKRRRA